MPESAREVAKTFTWSDGIDARADVMVSLFGKMAATYPSPIMEQAKDSLADLQAKTLEIAAKDICDGRFCRQIEHQQNMCNCEEIGEYVRAAAAALREGR